MSFNRFGSCPAHCAGGRLVSVVCDASHCTNEARGSSVGAGAQYGGKGRVEVDCVVLVVVARYFEDADRDGCVKEDDPALGGDGAAADEGAARDGRSTAAGG